MFADLIINIINFFFQSFILIMIVAPLLMGLIVALINKGTK